MAMDYEIVGDFNAYLVFICFNVIKVREVDYILVISNYLVVKVDSIMEFHWFIVKVDSI